MADRYKVTVEEDNDNGFLIGLIVVAAVIAGIIWVIGQIWWALLIGGIGVAIYKYNKKQKKLAPTKCPKCNKNNALEYVKTEVVKKTPTKVTVYSKQTEGIQNVTDTVDIIEYTHRKYEKCKFCGAVTFSDQIKNSL